MPRFILSSDTHLRDKTWTRRELVGDACFAFEQLVALCKKYEAGLILAGDIFDQVNTVDPEAIRCAVQAGTALAAENLDLFCICGNHDLAPPGHFALAEAIPGAKMLSTIPQGDYPLVGASFTPIERNQLGDYEEIADLNWQTPADGLVVLHESFYEVSGKKAHRRISDQALGALIYAGDYHQCNVKADMLDLRAYSRANPAVLSSGATVVCAIDEQLIKYAFLFDTDALTIKRLTVPSFRQWDRIALRLTKCSDDWEEAYQTIRPALHYLRDVSNGIPPALIIETHIGEGVDPAEINRFEDYVTDQARRIEVTHRPYVLWAPKQLAAFRKAPATIPVIAPTAVVNFPDDLAETAQAMLDSNEPLATLRAFRTTGRRDELNEPDPVSS